MSTAKKNLIHTIVAVILGVGFFCLVFFLRQIFDLRGWSDAFVVSGVFELGLLVIVFLGERGVFDMMGYGMYRLVGLFKRQEDLKWRTAYDFKAEKVEKRCKNPFFFVPYFIVAGIFLLIGVVLTIVVMNQIPA